MDIVESIVNLPEPGKDINIHKISAEWADTTFPNSMDPHPEYKLMANPTLEQMCNWDSFKIICQVFFVEGYVCALQNLSKDEEIEYYKKFCKEKKQNPDRDSNKFSFGAGLCYWKYNQLEDIYE